MNYTTGDYIQVLDFGCWRDGYVSSTLDGMGEGLILVRFSTPGGWYSKWVDKSKVRKRNV